MLVLKLQGRLSSYNQDQNYEAYRRLRRIINESLFRQTTWELNNWNNCKSKIEQEQKTLKNASP